MKAATGTSAIGWLPDLVYAGGRFEADLAFFVDERGRITRFSRDPDDCARARRLNGQAVLPGLVNAHSRALHRIERGAAPIPSDVAEWPPDDVYDVARMAFLEMLLGGTTCVGEWGTAAPLPAAAADAILRAARDTGIRIAFFGVAGEPGEFVRAMDALRLHVAREFPGDDTWLAAGLTDLDAWSVAGLKEVAAYAHAQRLRQHVVLSMDAEDHARCVAAHARTPVRSLADHGLLDKRVTAVHAGAITADDALLLGAARAEVCACPLAECQHGHPSAPVGPLRTAAADIALGTADGHRLNLLEVARHWRDGGDAAARLHAATVAGARSLGAPSGALEVGRPADFFTVNRFDPSVAGASAEGLLDAVMSALERRAIREVWVGARPRIQGGRHAQQGAIVNRFVELQQRRRAAG